MVADNYADGGASLPPMSISHGLYHACLVDKVGQVVCMGDNTNDQCGSDAAVGPAARAIPELANAGVTQVSCGYYHTCVVDSAQHALCFGANSIYGFLGTGDAGHFQTPIPQTVVDVDGGPALYPVTRVVTGGDQTCAILAGACGAKGPGQVVCWGYGKSGNLGIGVPEGGLVNSAVPLPVLAPQ
jgi:alpha-tubulin suppressor-like RCC1 family protein